VWSNGFGRGVTPSVGGLVHSCTQVLITLNQKQINYSIHLHHDPYKLYASKSLCNYNSTVLCIVNARTPARASVWMRLDEDTVANVDSSNLIGQLNSKGFLYRSKCLYRPLYPLALTWSRVMCRCYMPLFETVSSRFPAPLHHIILFLVFRDLFPFKYLSILNILLRQISFGAIPMRSSS